MVKLSIDTSLRIQEDVMAGAHRYGLHGHFDENVGEFLAYAQNRTFLLA